jgi:hypothetical protein
MGPEGQKHEPHNINPEKLPKVYEDVIVEDPDGGGYILDSELADPLIEKEIVTEEEIAQIKAELAKPDLDPKLRALFQTLLERKQNKLKYGEVE